jgi:hypothetical protein
MLVTKQAFPDHFEQERTELQDFCGCSIFLLNKAIENRCRSFLAPFSLKKSPHILDRTFQFRNIASHLKDVVY